MTVKQDREYQLKMKEMYDTLMEQDRADWQELCEPFLRAMKEKHRMEEDKLFERLINGLYGKKQIERRRIYVNELETLEKRIYGHTLKRT